MRGSEALSMRGSEAFTCASERLHAPYKHGPYHGQHAACPCCANIMSCPSTQRSEARSSALQRVQNRSALVRLTAETHVIDHDAVAVTRVVKRVREVEAAAPHT